MSLTTLINSQLNNSWRLYKLGVINLKYIKDDNKSEAKEKGFNFSFQEFPFYDGKALIIGNNGAGKTTLLQVFFPFIFDSSKHQRRIDPVGDRQIYEWVTGNSYIYAVFKKQSEYITLGIGLNSNKGSNKLNRWQFIIESNKDIINRDKMLFKKEDGRLRALTKTECKKKLRNFKAKNTQIKVFKSNETQHDYMKKVNNLLFGFDNLDEFKDFLKFYIKLKKSLTNIENTTLDNLIKTSLPNQSDTELAVDYLKKRKRQKEKLETAINENQLFDEIKNSYSLYNKKKVYTASKEYQDIANRLDNCKTQKKECRKSLEENKIEFKATEKNIENLKQSINLLEKQIKEIESDNNWESKLSNVKEKLKNYNLNKQNKLKKKEKKNTKCEKIQKKIVAFKQDIDKIKKELDQIISQLDYLAKNFIFHQVEIKAFIKRKFLTLDETLFKNKQNELFDKITKVKDKLSSFYEIYGDLSNKKDRKKELKEDIINKEKEIREVEVKIIGLKEKTINITNNNFSDKKLSQFIKNNIDNYYLLNEKLIKKESILDKDKKDFEDQIKKLNKEIKKIKQEIKSGKFSAMLPKQIEEFKLELESEKIPYQFLYKVIDFKEITIAKKQIIEGQLKDLGLLQAFLIPIEYKNKVINLNGQAKYIFIKNNYPTPNSKNNNITNYLKVVKNNTFSSASIINEVFENIIIDKFLNTKKLVLNDNLYKLSFLNGTSKRKEIKYIGIENRKKAKERKMASLEEKVIEIKTENIKAIELKLEFIKLVQTEVEKIIKIYNIKDKKLSIVNNKKEKKEILAKEINSLKNKLNKKVKNYKQVKIDDLAQLKELIKIISVYQDNFKTAVGNYGIYNTKMDFLNNQKEALDDEQEEINELKSEINELNKRISSCQSECKFYQEQLDSKEYQEKINTLDIKNKKKEEQEKQKITLIEKRVKLKEDRKKLKSKIDNLKDELKELKSEYIDKKDKAKLELESKYLKYILKKDSEFFKKRFKEKNKFIIEEFNKINKSLAVLKEKLKFEVKNINDGMLNYTFRMDELSGELFTIYKSERGKEYNFYIIYFKFKDRFAEIKRASENVENEFFDTFICSLTYEFINSYEKGLEVINGIKEILNHLQLSSGVKYKLKEKLIDNEKYDKDIFNIIKEEKLRGYFLETENGKKPETAYINPKAFKRLKVYIKNRLYDFEEKNKYLENKKSYEEFAGEILDYRKWIRFELRTVQGNSTDGKSGSEKIIGKLIGLATALKAKLKAGRKDNLKFLFLDEAFGKLDEGNEYVLFEFLNKIALDFLLIGPKEINDLAYQQIDKLAYITINKDNETQEVIVLNPEFWNKKNKKYEKQTDFTRLSDRINNEAIKDIEEDFQNKDKTIKMDFGDSNE